MTTATKKTRRSPKKPVQAKVDLPVVNLPYNVKYTSAGTNTIFTQFSPLDLAQLNNIIRTLYEIRNQPFSQITLTLDRYSPIRSTVRSKTTWREFIEGLFNDKVVGGGDYTTYQLKHLTTLFKKLELVHLRFKKR